MMPGYGMRILKIWKGDGIRAGSRLIYAGRWIHASKASNPAAGYGSAILSKFPSFPQEVEKE